MTTEENRDNKDPFPNMRRSGDALMVSIMAMMGRIESKVDQNQNGANEYRTNMSKLFSDHIAEEQIRQMGVENRMLEFERLLSAHHQDLMKAIHEVNVVDSLPRADDGKPDIIGHRVEHEDNRKLAAKRRDWFEGMIKDGLRWIIGAAALAAMYGIWHALLQGPKL